jgi:hypothetical protein
MKCLPSEVRGWEGEGQESCLKGLLFLIFVDGGRQCAIQAVSGAAVVQEEGTNPGAESKVVRVSVVGAG